jgi:hypothetical protein
MAGTDFQISMILKAVNEMTPVINQVKSAVNSLQTSITGLNKASTTSNWFDKAIVNANKFDKTLKAAQEKMDRLIASGKQDLMAGSLMGAPLVGMVKSASDLQRNQTSLGLSGLTNTQIDSLTKDAQKTMKKTMFNTNQVVGIDLALSHAGMDYNKIKATGTTATYLAELEANRNGADPNATANQFAQMTEQLKISNDTKAVKDFANDINKVLTVTHASMNTLSEGSKYFNLIGTIQGLTRKDIVLTEGMANRYGLEGSIGGTHLKDFFQRLNPYTSLGTKTGAVTLNAFDKLGWLNGVQRGKKGNITGFSGDVFHDAKGNVLGADKIFSILGQTYKKSGNKEQFNALLTRVLGQQGQDIAAAVAQDPEGFARLQAQMAKVPTIEQGITAFQQTFNQQFHAFTSTLSDFGRQIGTMVLPSVTAFIKRMNDSLPAVQAFIDKHKSLIKDVVMAWGALAGFKIGKGLFKITFGSAGKEILSILSGFNSIYRGSAKAAKAIKGFTDAFKYFKQGSGFIRSMWNALAFGNPILTKITSMAGKLKNFGIKGFNLSKMISSKGFNLAKLVVGKGVDLAKIFGKKTFDIGKLIGKGSLQAIKAVANGVKQFAPIALNAGKTALSFGANLIKLGAQAMATGIRMAAAWVVGLGPVGWIIMGVIAVVALFWAAWKTDFGHIREHTTQTVNWIKTEFNKAVDFFKNLPAKMSQFGKDMMNGLANGIKSTVSLVTSSISGVANNVVGTFKKLLGIHSPSRVMAEHGMYVVQGLAQGMNNNGSIVRDATMKLAKNITGFNAQPQLAIAGGYKIPDRLVGSSDSYQDKRQININIIAKDENEAYTGVKKALKIDDKYIASRRPKKKPWED